MFVILTYETCEKLELTLLFKRTTERNLRRFHLGHVLRRSTTVADFTHCLLVFSTHV